MDDNYFGGKKNKPLPQWRGEERGVVDKVQVGGVLDWQTTGVTACVPPDTKVRTVQGFVRKGVHQGAMLVIDEATVYRGMPDFMHESIRHSVFEYVRAPAHPNGLESFRPMLKRGCASTCHHVSAKHSGRYVEEIAGRHNLRDADTTDQMETMAAGFVGKRPQ